MPFQPSFTSLNPRFWHSCRWVSSVFHDFNCHIVEVFNHFQIHCFVDRKTLFLQGYFCLKPGHMCFNTGLFLHDQRCNGIWSWKFCKDGTQYLLWILSRQMKLINISLIWFPFQRFIFPSLINSFTSDYMKAILIKSI